MILTEKEAKTKWCPEARANAGRTAIGTTLNRDDNGAPFVGCYCLGSACMAWREIKELQMGESPTGADDKTVVVGGYCGKAGAP